MAMSSLFFFYPCPPLIANSKFHECLMDAKIAKINSTRKFVGLQYACQPIMKLPFTIYSKDHFFH